MASATLEITTVPPHEIGLDRPVSKAVFPDGLKTSGQHNPIYSRLPPYENYPKQISGPTVWKAEDYKDNPERWTHVFSDEEITELSQAADAFIAAGTPLTGMTKESFRLTTLTTFFAAVRKELIDGKGFILLKGIPVHDWGLHKCAVG